MRAVCPEAEQHEVVGRASVDPGVRRSLGLSRKPQVPLPSRKLERLDRAENDVAAWVVCEEFDCHDHRLAHYLSLIHI